MFGAAVGCEEALSNCVRRLTALPGHCAGSYLALIYPPKSVLDHVA